MENNIKKSIYNNIDYNTYENIRKLFYRTGAGLCIVDNVFTFNNPILGFSITSLAIFLNTYALIMNYSGKKYSTKDIIEIKKLYNEFLKNYKELNSAFDLNDPIQIYTMYEYLLNNGYLSINKSHVFDNIEPRDIIPILGANVMTGKSVCRHNAANFNDILRECGIESSILTVCSRTPQVSVSFINEEDSIKFLEYYRNLLNNYGDNNETQESIINILMNANESGIKIDIDTTSKKENIFYETTGNHAITFAHKDGINYFMDPTQKRIYNIRDDNKTLYDKIGESGIIPFSLIANKKEFKLMREKINSKFPVLSEEEINSFKTNTLDVCKGNLDILESFYNDNKEIYGEINDKILNIKPRGKLVKKVLH